MSVLDAFSHIDDSAQHGNAERAFAAVARSGMLKFTLNEHGIDITPGKANRAFRSVSDMPGTKASKKRLIQLQLLKAFLVLAATKGAEARQSDERTFVIHLPQPESKRLPKRRR